MLSGRWTIANQTAECAVTSLRSQELLHLVAAQDLRLHVVEQLLGHVRVFGQQDAVPALALQERHHLLPNVGVQLERLEAEQCGPRGTSDPNFAQGNGENIT